MNKLHKSNSQSASHPPTATIPLRKTRFSFSRNKDKKGDTHHVRTPSGRWVKSEAPVTIDIDKDEPESKPEDDDAEPEPDADRRRGQGEVNPSDTGPPQIPPWHLNRPAVQWDPSPSTSWSQQPPFSAPQDRPSSSDKDIVTPSTSTNNAQKPLFHTPPAPVPFPVPHHYNNSRSRSRSRAEKPPLNSSSSSHRQPTMRHKPGSLYPMHNPVKPPMPYTNWHLRSPDLDLPPIFMSGYAASGRVRTISNPTVAGGIAGVGANVLGGLAAASNPPTVQPPSNFFRTQQNTSAVLGHSSSHQSLQKLNGVTLNATPPESAMDQTPTDPVAPMLRTASEPANYVPAPMPLNGGPPGHTLDLTDPWGRQWNHSSPYDLGGPSVGLRIPMVGTHSAPAVPLSAEPKGKDKERGSREENGMAKPKRKEPATMANGTMPRSSHERSRPSLDVHRPDDQPSSSRPTSRTAHNQLSSGGAIDQERDRDAIDGKLDTPVDDGGAGPSGKRPRERRGSQQQRSDSRTGSGDPTRPSFEVVNRMETSSSKRRQRLPSGASAEVPVDPHDMKAERDHLTRTRTRTGSQGEAPRPYVPAPDPVERETEGISFISHPVTLQRTPSSISAVRREGSIARSGSIAMLQHQKSHSHLGHGDPQEHLSMSRKLSKHKYSASQDTHEAEPLVSTNGLRRFYSRDGHSGYGSGYGGYIGAGGGGGSGFGLTKRASSGMLGRLVKKLSIVGGGKSQRERDREREESERERLLRAVESQERERERIRDREREKTMEEWAKSRDGMREAAGLTDAPPTGLLGDSSKPPQLQVEPPSPLPDIGGLRVQSTYSHTPASSQHSPLPTSQRHSRTPSTHSHSHSPSKAPSSSPPKSDIQPPSAPPPAGERASTATKTTVDRTVMDPRSPAPKTRASLLRSSKNNIGLGADNPGSPMSFDQPLSPLGRLAASLLSPKPKERERTSSNAGMAKRSFEVMTTLSIRDPTPSPNLQDMVKPPSPPPRSESPVPIPRLALMLTNPDIPGEEVPVRPKESPNPLPHFLPAGSLAPPPAASTLLSSSTSSTGSSSAPNSPPTVAETHTPPVAPSSIPAAQPQEAPPVNVAPSNPPSNPSTKASSVASSSQHTQQSSAQSVGSKSTTVTYTNGTNTWVAQPQALAYAQQPQHPPAGFHVASATSGSTNTTSTGRSTASGHSRSPAESSSGPQSPVPAPRPIGGKAPRPETSINFSQSHQRALSSGATPLQYVTGSHHGSRSAESLVEPTHPRGHVYMPNGNAMPYPAHFMLQHLPSIPTPGSNDTPLPPTFQQLPNIPTPNSGYNVLPGHGPHMYAMMAHSNAARSHLSMPVTQFSSSDSSSASTVSDSTPAQPPLPLPKSPPNQANHLRYGYRPAPALQRPLLHGQVASDPLTTITQNGLNGHVPPQPMRRESVPARVKHWEVVAEQQRPMDPALSVSRSSRKKPQRSSGSDDTPPEEDRAAREKERERQERHRRKQEDLEREREERAKAELEWEREKERERAKVWEGADRHHPWGGPGERQERHRSKQFYMNRLSTIPPTPPPKENIRLSQAPPLPSNPRASQSSSSTQHISRTKSRPSSNVLTKPRPESASTVSTMRPDSTNGPPVVNKPTKLSKPNHAPAPLSVNNVPQHHLTSQHYNNNRPTSDGIMDIDISVKASEAWARDRMTKGSSLVIDRAMMIEHLTGRSQASVAPPPPQKDVSSSRNKYYYTDRTSPTHQTPVPFGSSYTSFSIQPSYDAPAGPKRQWGYEPAPPPELANPLPRPPRDIDLQAH